MIEIAQAKVDEAKIENITFECTAIDDFNVGDQSMDVVLGLSTLHLVENRDEVIAKVHSMLKPGGLFVSSTACLADSMNWLKFIVPIGRFLGLMPLVKFFSSKELQANLSSAGFEIEYQWQPSKKAAVFIVAKKAI